MRKPNLLSSLSGQAVLPVLMMFFCVGELAGVFIYSRFGSFGMSFLQSRTGCTFFQTLINSFSGVFPLLICCFAAGFCPIFQPICILVPIFRGIGVGITAAELCYTGGTDGITASAVLIVPFAVISGIIMSVGAKEALRLSVGIFGMIFRRGNCTYHVDVKLYARRFAVLSVLLAVFAAADSLATYFLSGLWGEICQ